MRGRCCGNHIFSNFRWPLLAEAVWGYVLVLAGCKVWNLRLQIKGVLQFGVRQSDPKMVIP